MPRMFGRTSCRSGKGMDAHPKGRERSGDPPGGLGGVGRLTQRSGRSWEAFPEVREVL